MARTRTLTQLIGDVRLRADNQALLDADITEFINQSIADLYDMLAGAFGYEYFETETNLSTVANVDTVALPSTFYKLVGLWWANGNYKYRILKMTPVESQDYITGIGWNTFYDVRYILQNANIKFVPMPIAVHTVTIKYIPSALRLVNGSDAFDGYNGWEEWVILDAALKCLEREGEQDIIQNLQGRKARMEARIANMADRDQAEPTRIQDNTTGGPWWRRAGRV